MISFPKDSKLKKIGCDAFMESGVESVKFPAGIEFIGAGAFQK